uniref:hypothetical protein n=1 Tax=Actinoalloteichus spitiensis TaxID=252394 RepID=UPI0004750E3C
GHAFGPAAGALPTAGPSSHEHPGRPGGAATGTRRANAHPEDGAGRETADYLEDTDDVWGDGDRVAPPVLGMPAGEEHR